MELRKIAFWFQQNWGRLFVGLVIGSGLGYGYYHFIGCNSGSCAITSNPLNSTIYGAVVGITWFWPHNRHRKTVKE
ncbi:MAG: DUF6132 family protein [Fidelibacterota bacterium]